MICGELTLVFHIGNEFEIRYIKLILWNKDRAGDN